jgi:hypothetical protein
VVGIRTVIGISLFFCTVIRIYATMTPFLNDIGILGGLALDLVPELPARSLFSVKAA